MVYAIILSVLLAAVLITAWAVRVAKGKKTAVCILPEDYGLVAQTERFTTEDGVQLEGWLIKAPNKSQKTIVFVHGFGMNKGLLLKRTHYLAAHYNLFYFDLRGAGGSAGNTEAGLHTDKDVYAAFTHLRAAHPDLCQDLGLYGISMGSAAAAYYTATYGGIKCLVLESSYYSFKNVAKRWMWKHAKMPYFPLVAWLIFWKEKQLGQKVDDFALKNTAPKITCPVLLIQGQEDTLTPVEKAEKTLRILGGPKALWVVPRAGHLSAYQEAPQTYPRKLTDFYTTYL